MDDEPPPFDPHYDTSCRGMTHHAPAMDVWMMEVHAQDEPVAPAAFTAADPAHSDFYAARLPCRRLRADFDP